MSQPLEVKAKFTIDPQGEKSVLGLAAAWAAAAKAAKAYGDQTKAMATTGGSAAGGGLPGSGQSSQDLAREQLDVIQQTVRERAEQKQLANERLRAAAKSQMEEEKRKEEARSNARRARAAAAAREEAVAAVERQGLVQSVAGQFGSTAGMLTQAGFRVAGAGSLAGAASAGVGVAGLLAHEAAATLIRQREVARNVNAPGYARQNEILKATGLGLGSAYEFGLDFVKAQADRPRKEGIAADAIARNAIFHRGEAAYRNLENTSQRDLTNINERSQIVQATPLDRAKTFDRSKVLGDRLYQEEMRLLPIRQQMTVAGAARLAAEKQAAASAKQMQYSADSLAWAEGQYDRAVRALRKQEVEGGQKNLTGSKIIDANRDVQFAAQKLAAAKATHEQQVGISRDDELAAKASRANENAARANLERAKLGELQAREQTAASQAQSLGGLSRGGFQTAKVQLEILKNLGIENVSEDIVAGAASIAPEFVRKEQERLGTQRRKELGLPEYRDDLSAIRKQVDEQQGQVTDTEDQNRRNEAIDAGRDLGKYIAEAMRLITLGIRLEIDKIKNDASLGSAITNR